VVAKYPFPLPDGWFHVAYGDDIRPGDVVPLHYFDRELVLFRTEAGRIAVLDAHCAHLGAHLGFGGRVAGESLRCPFHAWCYDADGRCVDIPYAKKIPPRAAVRRWAACERNGLIWVWHRADGGGPAWEVPLLPEHGDPDWDGYTRLEWTIRTRNQEIAENTADSIHFRVVHGFEPPRTETSFDGHEFRSTAHYEFEAGDGQRREAFLEIHWHGLGIGVTRTFGTGDAVYIGTCTPIDADSVHQRFSVMLRRSQSLSAEHGLGRRILDEIRRQIEQDIPIWENKAFNDRPLLCEADGPIGKFRHWASQFYFASRP
jgi:phenylpropionate dioxygenase-like ring-hydroxylating dioxygenase large terminal subunit